MLVSRFTLTTLTMAVLFSGANQAWAQKATNSVQKPTATASSEWERMQAGLRQAKPIPEPSLLFRAPNATESGGSFRFDSRTGRTESLAPSVPSAFSGASSSPGFPGVAPRAISGRANVDFNPPQEGAGSSAKGSFGTASITPTAPSPFEYPYNYPWNTYGRLLARFNDGTQDYYYLCSASVAASHHMVSAGHCVYNHDIRDDGSNIAGWAQEIWAWVAETDVVDPVDHDNWPDYPYGVAKMSQQTTYNAWINNSDLNWDFSFINLDRRIGDHVGWIGRETGYNASSLNFDGYPAQAPYVPSNNPYQYPGFDTNNVIGYTCCRIQMSAYTYGGHSGGPVWRLDNSNNRYLEGVNSTSDRSGYAEATLFTSQIRSDLLSHISGDAAPTDLPQVIENVFDGNEKSLGASSAPVGYSFPLTLNAFNAGYADAGTVTAEIYLTTDPNNVANGTYIGNYSFGDLGAYTSSTQSTNITIPTSVRPGNYYVGYVLASSAPQYNTDKNSVVIESRTLSAYCNADNYEADNASSQAHAISLGGTQAHSICDNTSFDPRSDHDWAKFTLTSPTALTLSTSGFAGGDTTMTLYNSSFSQLAYNDDNGTNLYSTISRTCASNPLPAGTYYVLIQSYGNHSIIPNYNLSLTGSSCLTSTSTALSASQSTSIYGQFVSYTATVTASGSTPTGTVTFYDGGNSLGAVTLSGGKASISVRLSAGTHAVKAAYSGTSTFASSTSPTVSATVTAASTTTALTSNLNPAGFGQSVTFTAAITPAKGDKVSGTVTFKDGSTTIGTAAVNGSTNTATFSIASLAAKTHSITAVYGGSTNTTASTSKALSEVVSQATSKTTLSSSANPANHGATITLTAKITPAHGGAATGKVTFRNGTATIGTASVNSSTHAATLSISTLSTGTHSLTAIYGGDGNVAASTSAVLSEVIH